MKFLNFGSLNLDYTYRVPHIVQPGETLSSTRLEVYPGGKGLNQSVALSRAGAQVFHAGMVGEDGGLLRKTLQENGIDARFVKTSEERSGNAIIQVAENGENSIVLYGGANQALTEAIIEDVLSHFSEGDCILLQNEVNLLDQIIARAAEKKLRIILNPSPFNERVTACDLSKVSLFLINEVEGRQMTGAENTDGILRVMGEKFPDAGVVLTLGARGSIFASKNQTVRVGSYPVKAVDTTAAGDTFTGYFLHLYLNEGKPAEESMKVAAMAAAFAVSRQGAVPSIPWMQAVKKNLAATR